MSALRLGAPVGLALLLLGLSMPGCLRISEPDWFSCTEASDCLAGERCSATNECAPAGSCESTSDCDASKVCQAGKCVAGECYENHDEVCGGFSCSLYLRACSHSCSVAEGCRLGYFCKANACVVTPNLADGSVCTADQECASRRCCITQMGSRACQNSPCTPRAPGASCSLPTDCRSGVCSGGSCL